MYIFLSLIIKNPFRFMFRLSFRAKLFKTQTFGKAIYIALSGRSLLHLALICCKRLWNVFKLRIVTQRWIQFKKYIDLRPQLFAIQIKDCE
jgi:hypothetical protein